MKPQDLKRWQEIIESVRSAPDFGLEGVLLRANFYICDAMEEKGVTRAQLADRLGVSRPWVTKLLSGNRNITVKSLVKVWNALGLNLETLVPPKSVGAESITFVYAEEPAEQMINIRCLGAAVDEVEPAEPLGQETGYALAS